MCLFFLFGIKKKIISVLELRFCRRKNAYHDELLHYVAFHLGSFYKKHTKVLLKVYVHAF